MMTARSPRRRTWRSRGYAVLAISLVGALTPAPVSAAPEPGTPVVVNSTGDDDDQNDGNGSCDTGETNSNGQPECTLRAAIETTNRGAADHIFFNIPTSDSGYNGSRWRISVQSTLPSITGDTEIEGQTQPGFGGTPVIELRNSGSAQNGIRFFNANGASVENLSIIDFRASGVELDNADNTTVANNYIGVAINGADGGNGDDGVKARSGSVGAIVRNNLIGFSGETGVDIGSGSDFAAIDGNFIGVTAAGADVGNDLNGIRLSGGSDDTTIGTTAGNVIANSGSNGIWIDGPDRIQIRNNTIGLTPNRQQQASNGRHGIFVRAGGSATIGSVAGPNVIGSNGRNGVRIESASADIIGNFIGTNPAGSGSFGNGFLGGYSGVSINNGSERSTVTDNVIANNAARGVAVRSNTVQVSRNLISANGALAIDLNGDGVTLNDSGDGDGGRNNLLNYPEIDSISSAAGQYAVTLALDVPSSNYTIELFENATADPSGFGEAERLIGSFAFTSSGSATTRTFSGISATPGRFLSATITDNTRGITSELGPVVAVPAIQNQPPSIAAIADQQTNEGTSDSVIVVASDPDGDALTFSATGLPPGFSINTTTGVISGTPPFSTTTSGQVDINLVTVTVTDTSGLSASQTFRWDILDVQQTSTTTTTTTTTTAPAGTTPPTTTASTTTTTTPSGTSQPNTTTTTTAPRFTPGTGSPSTTPSTTPGTTSPSSTTAPTTTTETSPTTAPLSIPFVDDDPVAGPDETDPPIAPAPTTIPDTDNEQNESDDLESEIIVAGLLAVDDSFSSTTSSQVFNLVANDEFSSDVQVTSVTQPEIGSVVLLENGLAEVTIPEDFSGSISFEYEIIDENNNVSSATVVVQAASLLLSANNIVEEAEETELTSFDGLTERTQRLFDDLVDVRLSGFQISSLSLAPPLLIGLFLALRRRSRYVAVNRVCLGEAIAQYPADGALQPIRHDQLLWSTNRTRTVRNEPQTLLETPRGTRVWVPTRNIVDTGY